MDEQTKKTAQDLAAADFDTKVAKSDKYVLVDFWASWCMPCMMMAPVLDEIADELGDKLEVMKVNTESADNQALAAKYQIRSIPNMKLFKNGEIVKDFVGFRPKEAFVEELKEIIG